MKKTKKMIADGPYIVVTGQIADGFEFTGPFVDYEEAAEWASHLAEGWWVETLHTPEH